LPGEEEKGKGKRFEGEKRVHQKSRTAAPAGQRREVSFPSKENREEKETGEAPSSGKEGREKAYVSEGGLSEWRTQRGEGGKRKKKTNKNRVDRKRKDRVKRWGGKFRPKISGFNKSRSVEWNPLEKKRGESRSERKKKKPSPRSPGGNTEQGSICRKKKRRPSKTGAKKSPKRSFPFPEIFPPQKGN